MGGENYSRKRKEENNEERPFQAEMCLCEDVFPRLMFSWVKPSCGLVSRRRSFVEARCRDLEP
jgi:hypothetical protein